MTKFKWLLLAFVVVCLLMLPATIPPASAMPVPWIFTCAWGTSHPIGVASGNGGFLVEMSSFCWYSQGNYETGSGWYTWWLPLDMVERADGYYAELRPYWARRD